MQRYSTTTIGRATLFHERTDSAVHVTPRHAPRPAAGARRSSTFLLKRLGFAAKEQSLAAYEETGLHPYHYAIMIVLDEGSRETQGSIADALGYDRGQLVGLLDELEEQGLVERRRDPNDRRRHLVTLTPEGTRTLGAAPRRSRARSRTTSSPR